MFTLRLAKTKPEDTAIKLAYKVNLPLQMAECEANYFRLARLISDLEQDEYRFMVMRGQQQWLLLLQITERSPYTSTMTFKQVPVVAVNQWLRMPCLTLRMYHDAKLAEVLAWDGHKRLRPRYDYPNRYMYQNDEKLQINQFLGECLTQCLNQGHGVESVMPLLGD